MKKVGITLLCLFMTVASWAQCSMCRAVVEKNENSIAEGLNSGIAYLMVIPYALLILVGVVIYRKHQADKKLFG